MKCRVWCEMRTLLCTTIVERANCHVTPNSTSTNRVVSMAPDLHVYDETMPQGTFLGAHARNNSTIDNSSLYIFYPITPRMLGLCLPPCRTYCNQSSSSYYMVADVSYAASCGVGAYQSHHQLMQEPQSGGALHSFICRWGWALNLPAWAWDTQDQRQTSSYQPGTRPIKGRTALLPSECTRGGNN